MKLYLHANYLNMIRLWVNALYGTHWDFNSYTGVVMLIGAA